MDLITAERLAKQLMAKHGLNKPTWSFQFDNAKRRFGVCRTSKLRGTQTIVRGTISLSRNLTLINDEAKVTDVILHEIAHALTPGHGHDWVWRAKCVEIGAKPERCYSEEDTNNLKKEAKYQATCEACGKQHGRHRMRDNTRQYSCRCQSGKPWSLRVKLNYLDTKR
jgi:predicted SprT family Zn-dependent metalloprotease